MFVNFVEASLCTTLFLVVEHLIQKGQRGNQQQRPPQQQHQQLISHLNNNNNKHNNNNEVSYHLSLWFLGFDPNHHQQQQESSGGQTWQA
mmetsp:Transcript_12011/g.18300  ORF Transcript_12011/g.18300 Transcript_12011/m.18300 type:complete len:90 (+) Transcript_12011:85-354(+)